MVSNRWEKAQQAELTSWKVLPTTVQLTDELRERSLTHMCEFTSRTESDLRRMRILEIGGNFIEGVFDEVDSPPRLILDPSFPFPRMVGQQDKSCHHLRGIAEFLPLPSKSIDLCWMANVIDHVSNPLAVLSEIWRVLDDRGMLVISCNIFPAWTKFLFPLFNYFDTPHPHHFTIQDLRSLLEEKFDISKERVVREFSLRRAPDLRLVRNLKQKLAALVRVRYACFLCTLNEGRIGIAGKYELNTTSASVRASSVAPRTDTGF